jgi:hypothetical protein
MANIMINERVRRTEGELQKIYTGPQLPEGPFDVKYGLP